VSEEARPLSTAAQAVLVAIAGRTEAAGRLEPPGRMAVLHSIVETAAALFHAEAASLALYDAASDQLVFQVSAGARGPGIVGVGIASHEGVAGYVFSTGQPLAVADVTADPRFGRHVAERTGYVPRSLLAVPLVDDGGTVGVLEVLDRRETDATGLRDIELATILASQAAVAIRATRLEHDTASLLRDVLGALVDPDRAGGIAPDTAALEELVIRGTEALGTSEEDPVWRLADRLARLRVADPAEIELLVDVVEALIVRAERRRAGGRAGR
jgi:GAF domain-containing protein